MVRTTTESSEYIQVLRSDGPTLLDSPYDPSIKVLRQFSQNSTTSDIPEIAIACSEGMKGSVYEHLES